MLRLTIAGGQRASPAPEAADAEVHVWRDNDGAVCASGYTVDGRHWMHFPGLASFRFGGGGEVTALPQPAASRDRIRDAYRRVVLPMALQALGRAEVLHASAVRAPQGVVALCAASETGKSTIAYGLSRRGYPLWADDAVAFDTGGRQARALPLPFRIRLRPASASFFAVDPAAAPARDGAEGEPAPLAALCVLAREPDEGGAAVAVRRLPLPQAFAAVLANACCFSLREEERKRRMMHHYLELTARVPVWEVRFRPGLGRLPAILDGIERAVRAAPPAGTKDQEL